MSLVYLGLGTNLGNKEQNLLLATNGITIEVGEIICQSTNYSSKPWGFESDNNFLNSVVLVETSLTPTELLSKTKQLERVLGRTEKTKRNFADRIIDIDILLYDNIIMNEVDLKIPHNQLHLRDFVLTPLLELAPNHVHPLFGKTITELHKMLMAKMEE